MSKRVGEGVQNTDTKRRKYTRSKSKKAQCIVPKQQWEIEFLAIFRQMIIDDIVFWRKYCQLINNDKEKKLNFIFYFSENYNFL